MKKNKKLNKIVSIILILVFSVVGLYVWEKQVYDEALVEKAYELFPSNEERMGINFKIVDRFESEEGLLKRGDVFITPGEKVERILFVKNHFTVDQLVKFVLFDVFEPQNQPDITVSFSEPNEFLLKPGEWRLVKMNIFVPLDVEEGVYLGKIAVVNQDVIRYSEAVNLVYGVANEFSINVVNQEKSLNYVLGLDPNLTPMSVALQSVYLDLKKVAGVLFAGFALFFLYTAFVYDRKKVAKKK